MNVLMIPNGYKGCGYVRLQLPAWHNGFELANTPQEMNEKLQFADVVVFHRPETKEYYNLAMMLKKDGKKIVMDNDDTFKIEDHHPLANFKPDAVEVGLKHRNEELDRFLQIADLVTTTTETLADEYRKLNDNVVILPNCVDPMDWDEPLRSDSKKVRIGLVGSVAFEYDYLHIKGVLRELSDRDDVQLCMFGLGNKQHRKENPNVTKAFKDDYKFWDSVDIEHQPWCPIEDYPKTLNESKLDIMLMPRKDNYFNRCKSNVKFLEASMCEIPVIAQSFDNGPYEELTSDTGLLIKDNKDWEHTINILIDNKELRRKIGKNAKEYVLKNYNIEDKAYLWEEAYKKLFIK